MPGIAIASFAHVHTEGYARELAQLPEVKIVGIWDEEPERGKAAAQRYQTSFEPNLEKLLQQEEVEGVVLCSPTSMHREIVEACARYKKAVFCEKPLAVNTQEAKAIVKTVEESGILFLMCFPSRTRPEALLAKRIVEEKLIGEITQARASTGHSAALDDWWKPGNWFRDPLRAGGGGFLDLGVHRMDLLRWLLGKPRCVTARIVNFTGKYEVDDSGIAVIEFASGTLASLDAGWVRRSGASPLELYGTEGFYAIGYPGRGPLFQSTALEYAHLKGQLEVQLGPGLDSPLRQFVQCLTEKKAPSITVYDGYNATELMEACYRSSQEGRTIELPLD